ncbi:MULTISPECIES: hydroxyacylglutathione hydrolase [unclassified Herbaspirillum]|uniref:hydroxyacylglutathione hydrolase n=1 Tax=unclassified Herbaspirillum TaxID=2624150 RepID=UPI000C09F0C5|nr:MULTISPECIES: hydroxyacylglutathione hydrolase [unclassified Herbaspirillum]MAF04779.1 hydroxyacylglutathione hydrolase [Herbaspirillum sp.]MBO15024.1 hydroxyacylglutathione hydrolase [Herbaspirillum sp.]
MDVLAVPAFDDNYLWIIHDGRHAAVVDPGDAVPVLAALQAEGLTLAAILLTHHHADHVGGVVELARSAVSDEFPVIPVYGPAREQSRIKGMTVPLHGNDEVTIPSLGLSLQVIDVPGHTLGHIAYYSAEQGFVFCGDTLFAGGCGRLFEGTPAQMVESLAKLSSLPGNTQVYCAHEYTLSNLKFAAEVEPGNAELSARLHRERTKRDQGEATVPTSIALERATNPFLRANEKEIQESLQKAGRLTELNEVSSFAALREWKNTYR